MSIDGLQRGLLWVMALGLPPIALAYGLMPSASLPWLFDIDATGVNLRHIFRAVMGLYLAMVVFWVAGAVKDEMRTPAMWSLFVFVLGIGLGRVVSILLDGWPNPLLVVFMVLEFVVAAASAWLINASRLSRSGERAPSSSRAGKDP